MSALATARRFLKAQGAVLRWLLPGAREASLWLEVREPLGPADPGVVGPKDTDAGSGRGVS